MHLAQLLRPKAGATLIEALVAVVVFSIFMVSLLPLVVGTALVRRQQADISEATALAQTQLEDIRRFWSVTRFTSGAGGYKVAVNYDLRTFPLFGETTKGCLPKTVTLASNQEVTTGTEKIVYSAVATASRYASGVVNPDAYGLSDVYDVLPTDTKVYSYGLVANPEMSSGGSMGTTTCIYMNSPENSSDGTNKNNDKPVRFIAQLFYGPSPNAQMANIDGDQGFNSALDVTDDGQNIYNSFRVAVRIYAAKAGNFDKCRGEISSANLSACLFSTSAVNAQVRATASSDATQINRDGPLVVQYTDIPRLVVR